MKKQLIVLSSLFILGFGVCQSKGKEPVEGNGIGGTKKSTAVVAYEQGPSKMAKTVPSDNIARLVELTLADQYKNEIAKDVISPLSRKFAYSQYDLNGDSKKEIFVALTGPYFCGSGGCTIYLLDYQGNVITRFTVAEYSIAIDAQKTNGWNDLLIESKGKFHVVKFDGRKYPSNPSVQKSIAGRPSNHLPKVLAEPYTWHNF